MLRGLGGGGGGGGGGPLDTWLLRKTDWIVGLKKNAISLI